jgi:hypothetical protein
VRRSLVPLAVCLLAVAAVPEALCATVVAGGTTMPVREHGPFLLSEVYQTIPGDYGTPQDPLDPTVNPDQIVPNKCFDGATGQDPDFDAVSVIPGVLCLDTNADTLTLNTNAFAICDGTKGEFQPFVQSFRLIKKVPGSNKVPMCYGDPSPTAPASEKPAVYYQFGSAGVRTWWTLKYTQPGTTFTLELTVRCLMPIPGSPTRTKPVLHIDRWTWKVVVTPDIFPLVLQMLASSPLSVLEFPCIADEGVLAQLVALSVALQQAVNNDEDTMVKQDAFMELEGYIMNQCLMADWFSPKFPDIGFVRSDGKSFPPSKIPGNHPTTDPSTFTDVCVSGEASSLYGNWTPFAGSSSDDEHLDGCFDGGIVDTYEDPCCCKLLADVEYIGNDPKNGILTP